MELQKLPLGSFILKNHQTDRSMPTMYIVLIHQSSHSEAKDTLCCNKCGRKGSPGQRTSDCHPEWHVLVLVLPSLQGDESGKPCLQRDESGKKRAVVVSFVNPTVFTGGTAM